MRVRGLRWLVLAGVMSSGMSLASQNASKPASKAVPLKSYCHPVYNFCFKYPAGWTMLGDVFSGAGVVVAPPQKQERELWDSVTVALVVPPQQGNEEPTTIGEAIGRAVSGVRQSGQDFETVERQKRMVNGNPAEMVKLHYVDKSTSREWTEELVFIDGPESEIYSVSLKSATASLPRIEPQFARIVDSWALPSTAPAELTDDGTVKPQTSVAKPKPSNPPKP
jgi:hypothetical protein